MKNKSNLNDEKGTHLISVYEEKIPIRAMARVVIQLGEELIENEKVALLEIIKNSYDADARHIFVEIDTLKETEYGKGIIKISDNGNGMTRNQVENGFLLISTFSKKEKKESPRYERIPLGEKGVGRLSAQRLAKYLSVRTKNWENDIQYTANIDWSKFTDNELLGEINADLYTERLNDLQCKENDDVHNRYLPQNNFMGGFGYTVLSLYGLNNIDFWDQKGIEKTLTNEVLKLISPFSSNDNLNVTVKLTNKFNDEKIISTDLLDKELLEDAAMYKVKFQYRYPHIYLEPIFKPVFYQLLEGNSERENTPEVYEENHIEIDSKIKVINILEDNDAIKHTFRKVVEENCVNLADPGDFSGEFYIYNYGNNMNNLYDELTYKYESIFDGRKEIKEFLKDNIGVKIYRDGFIVLPYGSMGNDWLHFTQLSQSIGSFFGPKLGNTIGYVEISSNHNGKLQEMTNRQGFILDSYGENFLLICREIAKIVTRESGRQSRMFSKLYPKKIESIHAHENVQNTINDTSKSIKNIIDKSEHMLSELEKNISNPQVSLFENETDKETLREIDKTFKGYLQDTIKISVDLEKASHEIQAAKKLYDYTKEEIQPLFEISSLGIIAEALTHELNKSNSNIIIRSQKVQKMLLTVFKKIAQRTDVQEILQQAYGEARLIEAETKSMDKQISHLAPGYRKRNKKNEVIELNNELRSIYINGIMGEKAKKSNININLIEKGNLKINSNVGLIIQVFDNLFINSEYWLNTYFDQHEIQTKEFNISIKSDGLVEVWDSGKGIDPTIENNIFAPFQTLKENGRGLGLYIVQSLLENQGCKIRLNEKRNQFNRRFIFTIDFSNVLKGD